MVPDAEGPQDDGRPDARSADPDGGTTPGFDEAALYAVVRHAVKDALLDVIGTVLLVGVAFVLVVAGGQVVLRATAPSGVAVGVALAAVGGYVAAATLEIIPPIRDWM